MSTVQEVFARNIGDNIAPVIYFHQIDPHTAAGEVGEYVFTSRPQGGATRAGGIHEQMTGLLDGIWTAIKDGHKLPASWISGYFGSGKSSFAKLLGLALDGMELPDGRRMDEALIARDDTPNAHQLKAAFARLEESVSPMAVIFDIGTAAKNNESIPHTVYRRILCRLGYSPHDGVAHFEIALEDDGRYAEFENRYHTQYGKEWSEEKASGLASQKFRVVYRQLYPEQEELLEVSTFSVQSLSIGAMAEDLSRVMARRVPGKTIFIIVDEVSQYISKDHQKMLALQSFVSEIGGRAKPGRSPLWLLVTGQEKLEEESKESELFKLQDRFPRELRVHLDRANVREVVGRRLLKKKPGSALEALASDAAIDALRLYAYDCAKLTKNDFIDSYPLLPAHIPLFMDITQSIRNTSIRTQSDSGGVRSVLNNIWDLFNREPVVLKDKELGTLMTLDMLYDIIGSSIDSDVLLTANRIFERHPAESWERKVVKAIALLELNGEQLPVTSQLLASLLYPALGSGPVLRQVEAALEALKKGNWIQLSEKTGWSIQNNAAQDWNRQKAEIGVSSGEIDEVLRELQARIVETVAQPVYPVLNVRFPLVCWWGTDIRLTGRNEATPVDLCFHWAPSASRRENHDEWISLSRERAKAFHWVSGETSTVESLARDYKKSQKMIARYRSQGQLSPIQNRLWIQEQGEAERNYEVIKKELRRSWLEGSIYFDGSRGAAAPGTTSFEAALKAGIEERIRALYNKFEQGNVHITDGDFRQLFERDSAGLATAFLDGPGRLGIAYADGGRIHFRASGAVPAAIFEFIKGKSFRTGEKLAEEFSRAPYGYSRAVIKSALIGLLREERIKISMADGTEITSILDPGARSALDADREFNRLEMEARVAPGGDDVTQRDRVEIRQFFEGSLSLSNIDGSTDSLADAVFHQFPGIKDSISDAERKLGNLGLSLPPALGELNRALTECLSSRQVEKTLRSLKLNLPVLKSGYSRLESVQGDLTEDTLSGLRDLRNCLDSEATQLGEADVSGAVAPHIQAIQAQLSGREPWRAYADARPAADAVRAFYRALRAQRARDEEAALKRAEDAVKNRETFALLDTDKRNEVLTIIESAFQDIDENAVQPTLVFLEQLPRRIEEAESRAQRKIDQILNEGDDAKRVHIVRPGFRNRMIESEADLDALLEELREKCLAELKAGATVRFEE